MIKLNIGLFHTKLEIDCLFSQQRVTQHSSLCVPQDAQSKNQNSSKSDMSIQKSEVLGFRGELSGFYFSECPRRFFLWLCEIG